MIERARHFVRRNPLISRLTAPIFGSYGRAWDFETLSKKRAIWLMGGDATLEKYEESGRAKAAIVAKFVSQDDTVLEIGCGMGRIMKQLAPSCGQLHGIDVSKRVLGMAREYVKELPNVKLYHGKGSDLRGIPSTTYDFCFANQVFSILRREDVLKYFADMQRVLKPGGGILVHFLSLEDPALAEEFRDYALESSILPLTRRRYYTADEVRILAQVSGFTDVSVRTEGDAHWLSANKPAA